MDGTGRWAASRGLPVAEGHREGARALRRTVEAALELGIESLAVYAFSTENWSRPADEVESIIELMDETIDRELPDLARQGVRTRFFGRRDRVPDDVSEADIAAHLYAPELPDPDLVIRTSGEQRLSNFLLWQSAYAELVFDETYWPDFGEDRLRAAVEEFASRGRRFGAR